MIRSIRFTLGSTGIVVGIFGACTKRDRNQEMNQSIELVARTKTEILSAPPRRCGHSERC